MSQCAFCGSTVNLQMIQRELANGGSYWVCPAHGGAAESVPVARDYERQVEPINLSSPVSSAEIKAAAEILRRELDGVVLRAGEWDGLAEQVLCAARDAGDARMRDGD